MTRRRKNFAPLAACAVFAAIFLAHAGLLPLSRWQGDEYFDFALQHQIGWAYVAGRFLNWSARPWSEIWLSLYGAAAIAAHRPLAGRFDALLWAGLTAACLGPAWSGAASGRVVLRLAFGMALLCLFLLGHTITEVFFWPAGAAAYLPTIAAAAWLFWCVADGLPTRRVPAAAALVLAAGSSEVGIFLVLAFSGLVLLSDTRRRAGLIWLAPALLVALTDLWILLHTRVGTIEILGPESRYVHHILPSLLAAIPGFFRDLISSGADAPSTADIATHMATAVLVMLGARWCLPAPRERADALRCLAAALLVASFATRAAAFYQFGELCCERHETMRQCLILLAFAAAGAAAAARLPARMTRNALAVSPLLAACILFALQRMPDLVDAYRLAPKAIAARAQTWESGLRPAGGPMTMVLAPAGAILHGLGGFDPGTYTLNKDTAWQHRGVMMFFGKQRLTILPPN